MVALNHQKSLESISLTKIHSDSGLSEYPLDFSPFTCLTEFSWTGILSMDDITGLSSCLRSHGKTLKYLRLSFADGNLTLEHYILNDDLENFLNAATLGDQGQLDEAAKM